MRLGVFSIRLSKRKYRKKNSSDPLESTRRQRRALNRDMETKERHGKERLPSNERRDMEKFLQGNRKYRETLIKQ